MQKLLSGLLNDSKVKTVTLFLANGEHYTLKAQQMEYLCEKDFLVVMYSNYIDYYPYCSIVKISTIQE